MCSVYLIDLTDRGGGNLAPLFAAVSIMTKQPLKEISGYQKADLNSSAKGNLYRVELRRDPVSGSIWTAIPMSNIDPQLQYPGLLFK